MKLRVSTLEAFRRVIQTEYGDEAELVDRIKRGQWAESEGTWQMSIGTAWHACLDGQGEQKGNLIHYGEYCFHEEALAQAKEHIGPGLREVTGSRAWNLGLLNVVVEGTCDHINGLILQDHKTKFSTVDAKDYEPSLQWRFYLSIHGGIRFQYNLFSFRDPKNDGLCELTGINSFSFTPYPRMDADLTEWLYKFVDWAESRRLMRFLENSVDTAKASA